MLKKYRIESAYHYVPLHYLPFIFRSQRLLSKRKLVEAGYGSRHFRSTSKKQDINRGFEDCVHLSLENMPRILRSKLKKGFPHFEIRIPVSAFEDIEYYLCRFNIAKTRYFRGAKTEPEESRCNGRYYGDKRLPIAISDQEKDGLLECSLGRNMIELLVPNLLELNGECEFRFFTTEDMDIAEKLSDELGVSSTSMICDGAEAYARNKNYVDMIISYINNSVDDPSWLGDGLEFDNV